MKILQVVDDRNPMGGGVARHVHGLCRTAAPLGVETALIQDFKGLAGLLKPASTVHIHGARSPLSAAAGLVCRLRNIPYVYTPHCYYDHGGPLKQVMKRLWDSTVERLLHRWAATSIFLNDAWLDDAHQRGFRPQQIAIIPNCVSFDEIEMRRSQASAGTLSGAPSLLSISRLDPIKRLEDAIHVLTAPGLEEAHFHIVGTGPDESRLKNIAAAARLGDRVHFHGWLDDIAATRLLRGADIFVLPSAREGMPTTMLEAFLLGCPVVASDTLGCAAIAQQIGWAYIHPIGDREAMARLICRAPSLDEGTIAAVREKFTWESRIENLLTVYRAIANKRSD
ncbi:MAG: glycosyltransferase family 4 protein [Alphaproteobacteria bacterium]|nr:glycosyltransferase family 4 protein [Alphaproteobacteria bacterium]MBU0796812.1 glycosyltransferase family 4 protein [Alphaproteobacteria bacterium]MBU0885830.1 glycosyltransferase family 4 protein [Alphaproteobacteria bacterium]MBU1812093.1 glycosyltransferase family 4 protein [Alphaproteobacteria bacterium]